jgi:4'-phosphopantetheinyl transferase
MCPEGGGCFTRLVKGKAMIPCLSTSQPIVYSGYVADFDAVDFLHLLSEDEFLKCRSFKSPEDELVYVITRGLLRKVLASFLKIQPQQIEITYAPNGRPYLSDYPNIKFNVSHTRDALAIAISIKNAIGVDIETLNRDFNFKKLKNFLYSESESHRGEQSFLKVWTIKEAIMKAKGIGLSKPLSEIELSISEDGKISVNRTPWDDHSSWTICSEIAHNHIISCAIEGNMLKPLKVDLWDL